MTLGASLPRETSSDPPDPPAGEPDGGLRRIVRRAVRAALEGQGRRGLSSLARAMRQLDSEQAGADAYRTVFIEAPIAIALLDADLRITESNHQMSMVTGRAAAELKSSPVWSLALPPHQPRLERAARRARDGLGPEVVEHRYRRADGGEGWARTALRRIDRAGSGFAVVCTLEDLTSDQQALEAQRAEAERDPLTGLLNRRGGDRRLLMALERMAMTGPVAVIICDADSFKRVNDSYGHGIGDLVLEAVAARLRSAVRTSDDVARMGGDEFLVVARVADPSEAVAIAQRCVDTVAQPLSLGDGPTEVTLSAGVAVASPDSSVRPQDLLGAADRALYLAKARGGGHWRMAGDGEEG